LKAQNESTKVRAAVALLDAAVKVDIDDVEARVSALEAAERYRT
jgi:3-dehydroquinate dehydratase